MIKITRLSYFYFAKIIDLNMGEIKLSDAAYKTVYKVSCVQTEDKKLLLHLSNLGIEAGESIQKLASNYGKKSFLVKAMGINYSLDKRVCEMIFVHE